jgi:hypothetical protein
LNPSLSSVLLLLEVAVVLEGSAKVHGKMGVNH